MELLDGKDLIERHSIALSSSRNLSQCAKEIVRGNSKNDSEKYVTLKEKCRIAHQRSYKLPHIIVGMEHHFKRLVELVLSSDGHKIGICGEGGCGKTLLTHLLVNEQRVVDHFEGRIISMEVGKNGNSQELQGKLYKEMTGKDKYFDTIGSGKTELHTLIKAHRCLLILDDVWDYEVLDSLDVVEPMSGSRIVLVTRDPQLLHQFKAAKMSVSALSFEDSWELFSKHAFKDELKDDRVISLAKHVVKYLDGLPLALIIVGSSMCGKADMAHWDEAYSKLKDACDMHDSKDERRLYEFLKLSYDELSREGPNIQECFIDMGLSDSGNVFSDVVIRWKALNLVASSEEAIDVLEILMRFCLLSTYDLDDCNTIRIHDHVEGLAAYVMQTEKPGQRITMLNKQLTGFPELSQDARIIELTGNKLEFLPEPITTTKLELLDLGDNPLTSRIPKSFFQAFQNLKFLGLYRIKAEVLFEILAGLTKLQVLYLSREPNDLVKKGHFSCKNDKYQASDLDLQELRYVSLTGYCPSLLTFSRLIEELHVVVPYHCLLHLPNNISSLSKLTALSISVQLDVNEHNASKKEEAENKYLFAGMEFKQLQDFGLHLGNLAWSRILYISKMNWQAFPRLRRLALSNLDWSHVSFQSFLELEQLDMHDYQFLDTSMPYYFNHVFYSLGCLDYKWGSKFMHNLPHGVETLPHLKILDVSMCPLIDIQWGEHSFLQLEELLVYRLHNVHNIPSRIKSRVEVIDLATALQKIVKFKHWSEEWLKYFHADITKALRSMN